MKAQQAPSPVQAGLAGAGERRADDRPARRAAARPARARPTTSSGQQRVDRRGEQIAPAAHRERPALPERPTADGSVGARRRDRHRCTRATRAVVPVHEARDDEIDGEEHRHHDDDDLDLPAGLVQHRAGEDLNDLRIGDGGAERAALDDVEVLAGERRDHDPQRLRQDDEEQELSGMQAEARAASCWPAGTASIEPRTISAMKAVA